MIQKFKETALMGIRFGSGRKAKHDDRVVEITAEIGSTGTSTAQSYRVQVRQTDILNATV